MRACTEDKRTIGDLKPRGQHLTPEERDQRAIGTVDRHTTDPDDRILLLAMLGLAPPPPKPGRVRRKPTPPDQRARTDRTIPPAEPCAWPCALCGRDMWHRFWPEPERHGRIKWGARDVCVTCYQKERREALQATNN